MSINKDGYIVIGDVVTSLKTDTKVPSIVINEVDGLYVITLDGKEYKMLAEGSAYNGLQSIIYRRQAADDREDFVRSIGLMSSNDPEAELLATSASVATFKYGLLHWIWVKLYLHLPIHIKPEHLFLH